MTKSLGYHQEEMANQPAEQEECGSDLWDDRTRIWLENHLRLFLEH
jgi:hypothetical protein